MKKLYKVLKNNSVIFSTNSKKNFARYLKDNALFLSSYDNFSFINPDAKNVTEYTNRFDIDDFETMDMIEDLDIEDLNMVTHLDPDIDDRIDYDCDMQEYISELLEFDDRQAPIDSYIN